MAIAIGRDEGAKQAEFLAHSLPDWYLDALAVPGRRAPENPAGEVKP
jgi:hypothetical protein